MNETRHAFEIQADQTLGRAITLAAGEPAPPDYTFLAPPEQDPGSVVLWVSVTKASPRPTSQMPLLVENPWATPCPTKPGSVLM